jgi:hypothetical protein
LLECRACSSAASTAPDETRGITCVSLVYGLWPFPLVCFPCRIVRCSGTFHIHLIIYAHTRVVSSIAVYPDQSFARITFVTRPNEGHSLLGPSNLDASPNARENSRITPESMRTIPRFASLLCASAKRSVSTLIEFTKALMSLKANELENIKGIELPRRSGRQRRKHVHSRRRRTRRGKHIRMSERDRKRKAKTGPTRT